MKHYIHTARNYVINHKQEVAIGVIAVAIAVFLITLYIYNNPNKIVYQPAEACKMFTPAEARDLLGDQIIDVNTTKPSISGNLATSKCSYTDSNPVKDQMIVAAIAVRSGVNDEGVAQNKKDFAMGKSDANAETVKDLGESAYFNKIRGQLNILDGRNWIILSYGFGRTPEENALDKAIELSRKVID